MNNMKETERLDKLVEGLDTIGLSQVEEPYKHEKYKKWSDSIDNISDKKFQKEYMNHAMDKAKKEIRPNTSIVFFWLGDKVVKEDKILEQRKYIDSQVESSDSTQYILVPEIVDIDYSEVKKYSIAKNGAMLEPYKDGFLIVRDDNPKRYQSFQISDYSLKESLELNMFTHSLTVNKNVNYYAKAGLKDSGIDADNFNLYFVFKRAYKNKAFKINIKNNKYFKLIFDKTIVEEKTIPMVSMLKTLPNKMVNNYVESLGIIDDYQTILDFSKSKSMDPNYGERLNSLKDKMLNYSKDRLLKMGYHGALFTKFLSVVPRISGFLKNIEKDPKSDGKNPINEMFPNIYYDDFEGITRRVLDCMSDGSISYQEAIKFNEKTLDGRDEAGYVYSHDLLGNILNLIIFINETEEGTALPITGKIDCSKATEIDCFAYWNYISNFNLFNGCLGPKDFPLILEDGKVFNEEEMYVHSHNLQTKFAESTLPELNEPFEMDPDAKIEISTILKEAMEQSTGLLIPYNACVELLDDPVFKYVRFIEYKKYIAIFIHDSNDRFITELYVKGEDEFRYWLYNTGQILDVETVKSSKLLYLKLAACIRDWKVLIERDSTMMVRSRPMVPNGVKTDKTRWIYLPRVKYNRPNTPKQKQREKVFFSESKKFAGERRHHYRKLRNGMKPSKAAMLLAAAKNFYVPEGRTYVKQTKWGKIKRSKREIKYRNTSLNNIFFAPDLQIKKAIEINQLTPGRFEEKMDDYVTSLGWEVQERTNYDGGIDIRAERLKPKSDRMQKLLVQCKHPYVSMKPIGPEVIRELMGSEIVEDNNSENVLMVITSSKFTPGAREIANKHKVILIDGDDLLNEY